MQVHWLGFIPGSSYQLYNFCSRSTLAAGSASRPPARHPSLPWRAVHESSLSLH